MNARINSISGLDFQKEYISIAQYFPDEHSVALVAIQPVEDQATGDLWDKIAMEFKGLRGKFKFSNPNVVCSVPAEFAVVKRMFIDAGEQEPSEAIEWELSQQIIGSMDEYAFDYEETGNLSQEQLNEYLVVAYRNQTVQKISSMTRNLKLNPVILDVDLFALINVFEANYSERCSSPAILVHAESDLTKLILTRDGKFLDFGTFDYEFSTLDAGIYASRLQEEVGKFLAVNGTFVTGEPIGIYLSGSLFSQAAFSGTISQNVANSELLFPFRKIGCRVGIDEDQLRAYAPQLAIAVGLALRGNDMNS